MAIDEPKGTDLLTAAATPRAEELPGVVLYVADGVDADRGKSLTLRRGSANVGTSSKCELQLTDGSVSRVHAELSVDAKGTTLRDLGSTNGTHYFGARIEKAVLEVGTTIKLGKTTLAVLPLPDGKGLAPDPESAYGALRGVSIAIRRVFALLRRLEGSDVPTLLLGETGTGKEVIARTLHDKSARRAGPFVVLDCGAIPPDLIDSELFGHKKGAFTGAVDEHAGVFEAAHGGTLFLDEIAELPLEQQPRLLRALESRQIRRVGETRYRDIDVRIIAATHRNLSEAIQQGRFREDLFYRLAVVSVRIPPLRDRREDIAVLAEHLAREVKRDPDLSLPPRVLTAMLQHDWPGNVRELRNAVQRLLALGEMDGHATPLTERAAEPGPRAGAATDLPYKEAKEQLLRGFEAEYVRGILEKSGGNISKAARTAGIARHYLRELMKKHGLTPNDDSGDDGDVA